MHNSSEHFEFINLLNQSGGIIQKLSSKIDNDFVPKFEDVTSSIIFSENNNFDMFLILISNLEFNYG